MGKKVLGVKHPETLTMMSSLGYTYHKLGRLDEAEQLELDVLRMRKSVLGTEHPRTIASMADLAWTWQSQNRHSEAFVLMEECLKLRTRILGDNHPETLSSANRLLEWQVDHSEDNCPAIFSWRGPALY